MRRLFIDDGIMKNLSYKNIVWDWNGTLLDDVDTGVQTLADMLERRGLVSLSREEYKARFGFGHLDLNPQVREVLACFRQQGRRQYILSALREDLLKQMAWDFGIAGYFEGICGSDNIYAAGKVERGKRMLGDYGILPAETLMIGDTLHDAEVATSLGFGCLLYAGGHNDEQRLVQKAPVIHDFHELF